MKHITPQAQNHIFKERRGRKPVPFQEISHGDTGFITLDELKVLEKRSKNTTMDSDSDSDDHTSVSFVDADTNDKNTETNDETNDDTLTTDEKETEEEDYLFEQDDDEVNKSETTDDRNDDEKNEETEELGLKPEGFTVKRNLKKKQKKLGFTMNYEQIDDEW
tara:strand:- start:669 stop:1157 length:489 start_codon:yes stop_codon:yes gene_type:complete